MMNNEPVESEQLFCSTPPQEESNASLSSENANDLMTFNIEVPEESPFVQENEWDEISEHSTKDHVSTENNNNCTPKLPISESEENEEDEDDVCIEDVAKKFVSNDTPFPNLSPDYVESEDDAEPPLTVTSDIEEDEVEHGVERTFNDEEEVVIEEKVGRWTFSKGAARKLASGKNLSASKALPQPDTPVPTEDPIDGLKLFRETDIQLPQHKPKQYSSFAEFRNALRQQKQLETATFSTSSKNPSTTPSIENETFIDLKPPTPDGPESGICNANEPQQPTTHPSKPWLRFAQTLPQPHLLQANDGDMIDLDSDENPVVAKPNTVLHRLISRFSQHTQKLGAEGGKVETPKSIEYSIVKKVADKETGELDLQLDTVVYKPDEQKTTTFSNRKKWTQHRQELCEKMREKRLKSYEERMRAHQATLEDQKEDARKRNSDMDEDDEEWDAEDEDEDDSCSSDSSSSSCESEKEPEEDDDGVNVSRKVKKNPFMDDEAEEEDGDDDDDEEDGDEFEDEDLKGDNQAIQSKFAEKCRASALSLPLLAERDADDFTDLPDIPSNKAVYQTENSNRPGPHAHRMLQRTFGEPGDVDLFATDTTLPSDKTLNMSKALSSTRYEGNAIHDQSAAVHSERSSWNDTPYSLLYSQRQVSSEEFDSQHSKTKLSDTSNTSVVCEKDTSLLPITQPLSRTNSTQLPDGTQSPQPISDGFSTHHLPPEDTQPPAASLTQLLHSPKQHSAGPSKPLLLRAFKDVMNEDSGCPEEVTMQLLNVTESSQLPCLQHQPDLPSSDTQPPDTQLLSSSIICNNTKCLQFQISGGDSKKPALLRVKKSTKEELGDDPKKPALFRVNNASSEVDRVSQDALTQPIDENQSMADVNSTETQILLDEAIDPKEDLNADSLSLFSSYNDDYDQGLCATTQVINNSQSTMAIQATNNSQSVTQTQLMCNSEPLKDTQVFSVIQSGTQVISDENQTMGDTQLNLGDPSTNNTQINLSASLESVKPDIYSLKNESIKIEEAASTQVKRRRVHIGTDGQVDGKLETEQSAPLKKDILEETKPTGRPAKRQQTLDFLSIFKKGEDVDEEEEEEEVDEDLADDDENEIEQQEDEEDDYSSSDEEMQLLRQTLAKAKKAKFRAAEFLEEEAELSGDEMEKANYVDENDSDSEDTGSLKDFVDENEDHSNDGKLRREVERVHNRLQADDDQRELRYLKEVFFEDGDLYDEEGQARQRRFRWRGIENDDPLLNAPVDLDNSEDDDDDDVRAGTSLSSWLTGSAGTMSRWLLQSGGASNPSTNAGPQKNESDAAPSPTQPTTQSVDLDGSPESDIPQFRNEPSQTHRFGERTEREEPRKPLLHRTQSSIPCLMRAMESGFMKPLKRYGSFLNQNRTGFTTSPSTSKMTISSSQFMESSNGGGSEFLLETREKTCVLSLRKKASLSCFTVTRPGQEDSDLVSSHNKQDKPSPFAKPLPKAPPKRPSNEPIGLQSNAKRSACGSIFDFLK